MMGAGVKVQSLDLFVRYNCIIIVFVILISYFFLFALSSRVADTEPEPQQNDAVP
jgi:hypothetical protein